MRRKSGLKIKICSCLLTTAVISSMLCGCGANRMASDSYADTSTSYSGSATNPTYSESAKNEMSLMNSANSMESSAAISESYEADLIESDGITPTTEVQEQNVQDDRKLIKTVDMNVETEDYDQLMVNIQNKVNSMGGYIESMNTSGTAEEGRRNGNISARVPADQVDQFVTHVSGISNITYKSENVEDVTLTYVDLDSHKKMLQAEEERLIEMMDQAETMEDIISIESRLTDVRYQIESMESQLRTFDNQIDYSTVTISVSEVQKITITQNKSALERMGIGFSNSMNQIGYGLKEFGIGIVVYLPYIILCMIILLIIFLMIMMLVKKVDRHMEKERQKKQ